MQPTQDDFIERYLRFLDRFDRFTRKLFGCEEKGYDTSKCVQSHAQFDLREWNRLRKQAKELFK